MALSTTINYDTPSNFTYDNTKIEVTTEAKLKLQSGSIQLTEDFTVDTGFTYDNSKVEFVGGVIRQKSQKAVDNTFAATYTSSVDATWSDGSPTASIVGGASILSGKLDLTGSTLQYVTYAVNNNVVFGNTFSTRLKYTPNYSGTPTKLQFIYDIGDGVGQNNRVILYNSTAGDLILLVNSSSGSSIINISGAWSPTAGTEYILEVDVDLTSGATRMFVDGVQFSSTDTSTGSRSDSGLVNLRIGNRSFGPESTYNADFSIDDLVLFSKVQNTSNHTPSYSLPEFIFVGSSVQLPTLTHPGPGSILSYDGITIASEVGAIRYTIKTNGGSEKYWNGTVWAISDGSYAQASSSSDIDTNLPSLTDASTALSVDIRMVFLSSPTQSSLDTFALDTTSNTGYSTTDPTIEVVSGIQSDELLTFSAISTASGSDSIQYDLCISGQCMYWNGTAWVNSDGTLAQSNIASDISNNLAALDIGTGKTVKVRAFLHSNDGLTTPSIASVSMTYGFSVPLITSPVECIVFGFIRTILADPHASAIELRVTNEATFYYNSTSVVIPNVQSKFADSSGNIDLSVIETTTPGTKYKFEIVYTDINDQQQTVLLGNATVPNQTTVNIATLTFS